MHVYLLTSSNLTNLHVIDLSTFQMQAALERLVLAGGEASGLQGPWDCLTSPLKYNGRRLKMEHGLKVHEAFGLYTNGVSLWKRPEGLLFNMFTVENSTVNVDSVILFDATTFEPIRGAFNAFVLGIHPIDNIPEYFDEICEAVCSRAGSSFKWSVESNDAVPFMLLE